MSPDRSTRRRAVVVGYNGGPGQLSFAHEDAARFGNVLRNNLEIEPEVLVGSRATARRIKEEILRCYGAELLILYFSGHADYVEGYNEHRLYLSPSRRNEAAMSPAAAVVPLHAVENLVRDFASARIGIIVIDACRADQDELAPGHVVPEEHELSVEQHQGLAVVVGEPAVNLPTLVTLLSCGANELAFENPAAKTSIFTDALCSEIENDANRTLKTIFRAASKKTSRKSRKLKGHPQRPVWTGPIDMDIWLSTQQD